MLRTGRVEVESGAGVARQRAVRRRAWFRRRPDSSRASAAGPWKAMPPERACFPSHEVKTLTYKFYAYGQRAPPHQERRHEDDMRNGNRSEYPKATTSLIVLLTKRSVVGMLGLADPITD